MVIALGYFWYIVYGILLITAVTILFFSMISRKFFKTIFLNAILGLITIVIINLSSKFTGVYIPLNYYTVLGGISLGIPSIIGFLILSIIFI